MGLYIMRPGKLFEGLEADCGDLLLAGLAVLATQHEGRSCTINAVGMRPVVTP